MRIASVVSILTISLGGCALDDEQSDEQPTSEAEVAATTTTTVREGLVGVLFATADTALIPAPLTEFVTGFFSSVRSCRVNTKIGACQVFDCIAVTSLDQSAGDVSFSRPGQQPLTLSPSATREYEVVDVPSLVYQPGNSIQVTATGAQVRPFTTAVTVPQRVVFSAPALDGEPLEIDPTQALAVRWLPRPAGSTQAVLTLRALDVSSSRELSAECAFDVSRGSGSVPASVLARFAGHAQVLVGVFGQTQKTLQVGGVNPFAVKARVAYVDGLNLASVLSAN